MEKELKYPIKYAVLEIKENGGYPARYQELTRGFIASKCYVISSSIEYLRNGDTKISHQVVFPHTDYELFKRILYDRREVIGDRIVPRYNACDQIYPCTRVSELYDDYDSANQQAETMNEEFQREETAHLSLLDPKWKETLEKMKAQLELEFYMCKRYGELIEEETKDMVVTKEIPQLIKKK